MSVSAVTTWIDASLAVVRLGDVDRLGWWRSHSLDETGEYVLADALPNTWMATALELAMESARVRHEAALGRSTAVHLFSDYLPFHRLLRNWLIERKLERDVKPLVWLTSARIDELKQRVGPPAEGERRGTGLFLGEVPWSSLEDGDMLQDVFARLASGYSSLDGGFAAPYMDLV